MKKILIILISLLCLTSCKKDDSKLILVTEAGFAPYEYYEKGEVGVDIDIAKEIAKRLGKELVVKDIAFDSIINELNSSKADFAAAGISITPEREEEVDFSIEYALSKQVIIVRKGYNKISTLNDLSNKTISVQLGSVADSYVNKNYKNAKIVSQKKYLTAAQDVKSLKSDCLIMDELPAKELVKSNTDLEILNIEVFTDKYAIAVKKGNTNLLNQINKILTDLINKEGGLSDKWVEILFNREYFVYGASEGCWRIFLTFLLVALSIMFSKL